MAAPVSRAGSAVWTGGQAGREATVEGERAVSPGPELSPLEPRPSPLAAGEGSAEGRAPGRISVRNSGATSLREGWVAREWPQAKRTQIKGAKLNRAPKGAADSAPPRKLAGRGLGQSRKTCSSNSVIHLHLLAPGCLYSQERNVGDWISPKCVFVYRVKG